jgi:hypothetical protein
MYILYVVDYNIDRYKFPNGFFALLQARATCRYHSVVDQAKDARQYGQE